MKIQKDKKLHLIAGFLIGSLFCFFFGAKISIGAAIIAGVGKEIYDSFGFGTVDTWDAVATIVGGVVGAFGVAALFQ